MGERLSISVSQRPDHVVVSVAGDIDANTEREFRDGLVSVLSRGALRLVLDFSKVNYISSGGTAVLLGVQGTLATRGGSLVLASASPAAARMLALTQADQRIPVADSAADAVVTGLSVSVTVQNHGTGPCTVVRLAGEADASTQALGDVLKAEMAKNPRLLLIEMSRLMFIDSFALNVILRAYRKLSEDGRVLALVSPSPRVAWLLHLIQADRVIPIYGSAEEAAAAAR